MNVVNPKAASANPGPFSESKTLILNDIRAKWGKFSEDELGALESNDDLVTQIAAKYSLDKAQVSRDVDTVLKGRQI
jgi:division protein CdvB (Snf7/Vps24/ESCRT-III family)